MPRNNPTEPRVLIRKMGEQDLAGIVEIQRQAYSDAFLESPLVFMRKLQLAPDFCWVAQWHEQLVGYLFSHPWEGDLPPALHTALEKIPSPAKAWFVHDMAISPLARGMGLAWRLYEMAHAVALEHQLQEALLVAMPDVDPFWSRFGYQKVTALTPLQRQKLAQYGPGSHLMHQKMTNQPGN